MDVSYTLPLKRAWQRMQNMLFRPFRLETWLVVGFSAFLAYLGTGSGGSTGSWNWKSRMPFWRSDSVAIEHARHRVLDAMSDPFWLGLIAAALIVFALFLVVVMWVSTRARFVFMHNVATGRPEFKQPWRRFGRLGVSLLLWLAVFSFAWLLPLAVLGVTFAGSLMALLNGSHMVLPALGAMIAGCGFAALMILALFYVAMLTDDYIVPIMYKHDLSATQAWARFLPLFTSRFGEFFAFALFQIVLLIGVVIGIMILGFATCCVGWLVIAIPYVGTVLLLPIYVMDRGFTAEFLAQFGPEWDVFATAIPAPAPDQQPSGAAPSAS